MAIVCGIDFGTSNSAVGVFNNGQSSVVPIENDDLTIPSAIFYPADGATPAYGRAAIHAYAQREQGRLLRSLKSILGSRLIEEKTAVGGKYQSFEDILVGFIEYLRNKVEQSCGPIDQVVMGRPIHFVEGDDQADQQAQVKLDIIARKAGFRKVLFQYEPIAAALQYEVGLVQDELVLVADIGGGTSDFSILKVGPSHASTVDRARDVLATEGTKVGGTNLDTRLSLATVMPLLGAGTKTLTGLELPKWPFVDLATWHRIHTITDARNRRALQQIRYDAAERAVFDRYMRVVDEQKGHLLARQVEDAKIELTNRAVSSIDMSFVNEGLIAPASRNVFEGVIDRELAMIDKSLESVTRQARFSETEITTVFLTGGTSAVPAVRHLLTRRFKRAKVVEGDLLKCVAYGLAVDAGRRFGALS